MSPSSPTAPGLAPARLLSLAGLFAVFIALAWRMHAFVDANCVNMMFWDQWDLYIPFFEGRSNWDAFTYQAGSHRMGIAFLITRAMSSLNDWNVRWDAFAISFTMMAAALLALRLATRCGLKLGIGLVAIPLFFFNIRQYEVFVGASNLSHSSFPVLMLILCCLAWFWKNTPARLITLSVLNFMLVFTGYGIFAGLIIPAILFLELVQHLLAHRRAEFLWSTAALFACASAWVVFAQEYIFVAHLEGLNLAYAKPIEYLYFVGLMLANFLGVPGTGSATLAVGYVFFALLIATWLWHGLRLLRLGCDSERISVVIFFLSSFGLVYVCNTALGRVSFGWEACAVASRYVPLMVPGALALLLQAGLLVNRRLSLPLITLFTVATAVGTYTLRKDDLVSVTWYRQGRLEWRQAYLATHDIKEANRLSNFQVFPRDIDERIKYLEDKKLNLFAPARR